MRRFNWQIFISFNLLFTFVVMLISGVILYFKPEGSVARWLAWDVWGLTKSGWEAMHTVFSFLFLIFAVLHIVKIHLQNIRLYFLNYKPGRTSREMNVALLISAVFLIGTAFNVPPFHWIFKAGNYLSDSWGEKIAVKHEAIDAKQPMREVAIIMGIKKDELLSGLGKKEIDVSMQQSLRENAENNGLTPYELYNIIRNSGMMSTGRGADGPFSDITLEDMAAILDINTAKLVEATQELYKLENTSKETYIDDIARKTNQRTGQVREAIISSVSHLLSFP